VKQGLLFTISSGLGAPLRIARSTISEPKTPDSFTLRDYEAPARRCGNRYAYGIEGNQRCAGVAHLWKRTEKIVALKLTQDCNNLI
jgi:hypothetical protein